MLDVRERIDGVVIGILSGFEGELPQVAFGSGLPQAARSLVALDAGMVGAEVAVVFEGGDAERPLIVGRVLEHPVAGVQPVRAVVDGERVCVRAEERIELRCGKASVILEKDGRIVIRGTYVTSHASAANRIRGGSVNLN